MPNIPHLRGRLSAIIFAFLFSVACAPEPPTIDRATRALIEDTGPGVDRTSESGVQITADGSAFNMPAANAIDDDIGSAWRDSGSSSALRVDFGGTSAGAFAIETYSLTSASAASRDPHTWTLAGSNDGSTWTTLDSRSGEQFTGRRQTRYFSISSPTSFRHYRLSVSNSASILFGSIELAELELIEDPQPVCGNGVLETGETCDGNAACTVGGYAGSQSCNSTCTGYGACTTSLFCGDSSTDGNEACDGDTRACTTGGYAGTESCDSTCTAYGTCTTTLYCGDGICSSGAESTANCPADCTAAPRGDLTGDVGVTIAAQGENANYNEVATNLVDDDVQTKWLDFSPSSWIEVDLGASAVVDEYSMTSANDAPERDPYDFSISGSHDGTSWTTLDTRTAETWTQRGQTRAFLFTNTTAYRHYRLDIATLAARSGQYESMQLAQIELIGGASAPPPPVCGDGTCDAGEDANSCAADCGPPPPVCGDGTCDAGEDANSCAADCGPPPPVCGDGTCDAGEDANSCAADCGPPPPVCGDGSCDAGEGANSCAADCGPPPPVCGDGTCDAGEDANSCAADCSAPVSCGNGTLDAGEACDAGLQNGAPGRCNSTCTSVTPRSGPPSYGGVCPTLFDGMNTGFQVPGADASFPVAPGESVNNRSFIVQLPANPVGAPVIFTWHWYGGAPDSAINFTGLGNVGHAEGVIIVSPVSIAPAPQNDSGYFEWYTGGSPDGNPDLELAKDVLGCLYEQFDVDLDRLYVTGHSAGAMFTSWAALHWGDRLAASLHMSGGEQYLPSYRPAGDRSRPPYVTPSAPARTLVVHGGQSDQYAGAGQSTFSFRDASLMLSSDLRSDGGSTVECDGGFGHAIPPNQGNATVAEYLIWPYFLDHPRSGTPYTTSLDFPASFPAGWCTI